MGAFQLFVGVLDTCLVWYSLVLPSEIHAFAIMNSLEAIDGHTSYHSFDSFSFKQEGGGLLGLVQANVM